MMSENSKLCVGCMSFGKAGTMHDWTLDEAQTDEMVAGHLARPTWKSESLRGRTDRVAVGKYDCMEEADMKIVTHVHELAEDIAYLEECYVPHPIVGAIDKNPAQGVMLLMKRNNWLFYHSQVYQLIRDGVSDMHCMSDGYLAEELEQEYVEKSIG